MVEKIGIEVEGVLLSTGKIIGETEFIQAAEIDVDLGALGIRTRLPILDRYSPLAYSIAQYVHWDLAVHRGQRLALGYPWSMLALCRELLSTGRLE